MVLHAGRAVNNDPGTALSLVTKDAADTPGFLKGSLRLHPDRLRQAPEPQKFLAEELFKVLSQEASVT